MGMGVRGGMGIGNSRFIGGGNLIFSILNLLILLAILGCVIYLVVKAVKDSKKNKPVINSQSDSVQAVKILDERFARGEITEEEYKVKKELILK
jgi:Predicted membrane protein